MIIERTNHIEPSRGSERPKNIVRHQGKFQLYMLGELPRDEKMSTGNRGHEVVEFISLNSDKFRS
jgi:hypothetical protein